MPPQWAQHQALQTFNEGGVMLFGAPWLYKALFLSRSQGVQDTIDLDNIEHMFPDAAEVGELEAEHNDMQLDELS